MVGFTGKWPSWQPKWLALLPALEILKLEFNSKLVLTCWSARGVPAGCSGMALTAPGDSYVVWAQVLHIMTCQAQQ